MGKYILRRILQMIPVVLGTTLLIYALVFALPGDPVAAMFGDKPVNETVAAQIRAEYNLDKPFFVQYLLFLKNAITFNFGKTFGSTTINAAFFGGLLGVNFLFEIAICTFAAPIITTGLRLALRIDKRGKRDLAPAAESSIPEENEAVAEEEKTMDFTPCSRIELSALY